MEEILSLVGEDGWNTTFSFKEGRYCIWQGCKGSEGIEVRFPPNEFSLFLQAATRFQARKDPIL